MKFNLLLALILGLNLGTLVGCTPKTESEAVTPKEKQEIKITGAGTPYTALKALAKAYEEKEEGVKITFLPPSQSPGGIAGAQKGLVDLGSVTRKIKPEEDDGSLEHRQLAQDGLVVATHPSVEGVTNLDTEQLKDIYSGKITNWQEVGGPNATIVILDRPEDESAKKILREYYLGEELETSSEAIILREESDLIENVQATEYSIGAFSLANAISNDLPVNRLSLDGVEPTPENVKAGDYEMTRKLGIVYQKEGTPEAASQFIDFAFSEAGGEVLEELGFVPSE